MLAENITQNDPRGSKSPERGGVEAASCSHGSPVHVQVTVSTPSQPASYTNILGGAEGKVARALLGGHSVSIAKAVLSENDLKEAIIKQVLAKGA